MKYFLAFYFLLFSSYLFSQENIFNSNAGYSGNYNRIDGTHLLKAEDEIVKNYLRQHPNALNELKLSKSTAWGFKIGDTKNWYSVDFATSTRYIVNSTCRAVGNKCYIFVENSLWNNRVKQLAVDSVKIAFDQLTPNNPNKGIYQTDVETFGDPPDVDNDPKIIILIQDIKDGYDGAGGWIWGFFSSMNEIAQSQSNKAEIFYIDANPTNLSDAGQLKEALSTLAHEFQHMIHWNYKRGNQLTFINEGCSCAAEFICGYSLYSQSGYINETNHYLFDWRESMSDEVLRDYSRAARFTLYLYDQYGTSIFTNLVQSSNTGIESINEALQAAGSSFKFIDVFKNWAIANILNEINVDPLYGYKYKNLPSVVPKLLVNPNINYSSGEVQPLGVEYLLVKYCSNFKITVNSTSSVVIKAIAIGPNKKKVTDILTNNEYSEPELGSEYTDLCIALINTDLSGTRAYSIQSSGSISQSVIELKYDETEPSGVLVGSAKDSVCVIFKGIPGARLDSLRIALRGTQSMEGGIWKYNGTINPSPLGQILAFPIRVNSSLTERPPVPYPVPWPNWGTIDLTSYKIDASNDFAVAFADSGEYVSAPYPQRIMVNSKAGQNNSISYSGSLSTPRWGYPTNSNGDPYLYYIRAYISLIIDGITKVTELTPGQLDLSQNYPNPFNPTTTINFSIPEKAFVSLDIYNSIGQKVTTLASKYYEAGNYHITWNATNFSSGVYYYKLTSDRFSQVKKLMLLK